MNPLRRALLGPTLRWLRGYRRSGLLARAAFERDGVWFLPRNYYAALPTTEEVERSFEYAATAPPWLLPGLFDAAAVFATLDAVAPYRDEFVPPRSGNPLRPDGFYWDNGMFGGADALFSYSLLRHLAPRRVVEVGSGFSTLLAAEALRRNGHGEIVCIEPHPRPFLRDLDGVAELVERPVQEVPPERFAEWLGDGDVLFIDSSHTVKAGGDCLHLYLRVLPALGRDLWVHVHDVFLPGPMPKEWLLENRWYWTEQYLLLALLVGNEAWRVAYGTQYLRLCHPERLDAFVGSRTDPVGGSLWFRTRR